MNEPRHCRMCDRPATVRPLTRHHIVPQWWFRDQAARRRALHGEDYSRWPHRANVPSNIVRLCRPCHDLIDHGPRPERLRYRRMLRALLFPDEVAFARSTRGDAWLEDEYPVLQPGQSLLHPESAVG